MAFKVGDPVKVAGDSHCSDMRGRLGLVLAVDEEDKVALPYYVAFQPVDNRGFSGGTFRWMSESSLESAEVPMAFKFHFGDKVRYDGEEYVVIGIDREDDGLPYLLMKDQSGDYDMADFEAPHEWATEEALERVV